MWDLIIKLKITNQTPKKIVSCHFGAYLSIWKKCTNFKMATFSRGRGRWRSNSRTRCLLPLAMCLPTFVGITRLDLENSAKVLFQTLNYKMAAISRGQGHLRSNLLNLSRAFGPKFRTALRDHPRYMCAKYHGWGSVQN